MEEGEKVTGKAQYNPDELAAKEDMYHWSRHSVRMPGYLWQDCKAMAYRQGRSLKLWHALALIHYLSLGEVEGDDIEGKINRKEERC